MSENTQQPGGGPVPHDPWAPPEHRVDLGKQTGRAGAPDVHSRPTVASMPGADAGTGPIPGAAGGFGPPQGSVPPPPAAPVQPQGQYGYPAPAAPAAPYAGYPGYPGQVWGGPAPANGMGTAAMVLGILALCLFCLYGIPSLILGVLALIFGILGRKRAQRGEATNPGQALAGIIMGAIGIVTGIAIISFFVWLFVQYGSDLEEDSYRYEDPYATTLVVEGRH
ncbi:DUF4190 domain-containing protein [Streptomyces nitrosporeus]|uniref:DUF4190 domain-containing protein n=1 Tax=Streptomyces nitrosporeus TaxID=28894 RepID=UPI00332A3B4D